MRKKVQPRFFGLHFFGLHFFGLHFFRLHFFRLQPMNVSRITEPDPGRWRFRSHSRNPARRRAGKTIPGTITVPVQMLAMIFLLSSASPRESAFAMEGTTAPGSVELVENSRKYDGMEIIFEGEAIGEVLRRGDHAWINLLDDSYALGVWLDMADARIVKTGGSYARSGDRLRVRGIYHRSCPEHGGDMDIHASSAELLELGHPVTHPVDPVRLGFAALLFCTAVLVLLLWHTRERGRKP